MTQGLAGLLRVAEIELILYHWTLAAQLRVTKGASQYFQSNLSHLKSPSVARATFTRFLMEHGSFQYYLYSIDLPGG